jgi:hypothetical protein
MDGLINLSAVAGILVGTYIGSVVMNKVSNIQAGKNHGHFGPERRLVGLVMAFVIVPAMSFISQSRLTLGTELIF